MGKFCLVMLMPIKPLCDALKQSRGPLSQPYTIWCCFSHIHRVYLHCASPGCNSTPVLAASLFFFRRAKCAPNARTTRSPCDAIATPNPGTYWGASWARNMVDPMMPDMLAPAITSIDVTFILDDPTILFWPNIIIAGLLDWQPESQKDTKISHSRWELELTSYCTGRTVSSCHIKLHSIDLLASPTMQTHACIMIIGSRRA